MLGGSFDRSELIVRQSKTLENVGRRPSDQGILNGQRVYDLLRGLLVGLQNEERTPFGELFVRRIEGGN
jgi:hypothetical protein